MSGKEVEQKVMEICDECERCRGTGKIKEITSVPWGNTWKDLVTVENCPSCETRAIEILEDEGEE